MFLRKFKKLSFLLSIFSKISEIVNRGGKSSLIRQLIYPSFSSFGLTPITTHADFASILGVPPEPPTNKSKDEKETKILEV